MLGGAPRRSCSSLGGRSAVGLVAVRRRSWPQSVGAPWPTRSAPAARCRSRRAGRRLARRRPRHVSGGAARQERQRSRLRRQGADERLEVGQPAPHLVVAQADLAQRAAVAGDRGLGSRADARRWRAPGRRGGGHGRTRRRRRGRPRPARAPGRHRPVRAAARPHAWPARPAFARRASTSGSAQSAPASSIGSPRHSATASSIGPSAADGSPRRSASSGRLGELVEAPHVGVEPLAPVHEQPVAVGLHEERGVAATPVGLERPEQVRERDAQVAGLALGVEVGPQVGGRPARGRRGAAARGATAGRGPGGGATRGRRRAGRLAAARPSRAARARAGRRAGRAAGRAPCGPPARTGRRARRPIGARAVAPCGHNASSSTQPAPVVGSGPGRAPARSPTAGGGRRARPGLDPGRRPGRSGVAAAAATTARARSRASVKYGPSSASSQWGRVSGTSTYQSVSARCCAEAPSPTPTGTRSR